MRQKNKHGLLENGESKVIKSLVNKIDLIWDVP